MLTIEPALREAVAAATVEAEQAICPLYEVRPQQRLAFLDDLDSIRCIDVRPRARVRGRRALPAAHLERRAVSRLREGPHHTRHGDVEIRRYEHEAKVLRVDIDGHASTSPPTTSPTCWSTSSCPTPAISARASPTRSQRRRGDARRHRRATTASSSRAFRDGSRDLARLLVKGSRRARLGAGARQEPRRRVADPRSLRRGAARKRLIVCPQDLVAQWQEEARKFYGIEPEHIRTPCAGARRRPPPARRRHAASTSPTTRCCR